MAGKCLSTYLCLFADFWASSVYYLDIYTVNLELDDNFKASYDFIFQEYEETCLFTLARFSASESLRVYPNIYKISPPFASSKGVPQVGFAMRVRELESASYSIIPSLLALRADVSILARALFSLFAFYSYIPFNSLIIASAVI